MGTYRWAWWFLPGRMRKGFRGWMINGVSVVGKRGGWQRWLAWRNSWPKFELKAYVSLITVLPVWRHKCEMRLKNRVGFLDGEEATSRSWGSVTFFVVTGSWNKFSYYFSGVFVGGGGGLLTFFPPACVKQTKPGKTLWSTLGADLLISGCVHVHVAPHLEALLV